MTIQDFRKLKQIIDQAIVNVEDPDKQKEIIKTILSEAGVFYSEWIEFQNMIAEGVDVKSNTIKEELTNQFEQRLSETDIKISNIKPSVINKIVKQITKEKPIITNKTEIIEKTIREVDPTSLEEVINRINNLEEKLKGIKIPKVPDYQLLKKDLESYSADYISGKWGEMPSFRALGMGLRGDIDNAITRIIALEGGVGHDAVTINATANGLTLDGQEIALGLASTSTIGALSDTDWDTFNGKIANMVEDTTPELGGELDCGAHSIGFTQQTATGDGTTTIDWKLGNKFYFTFGAANETFTFTAPTNPCNLVLVLKQDGTGSRTATWPNTVKWPSGTAPTLTTTANAVDIVSFYWDGTNYHGVISLAFSVPA
jgi:tetrahydromethanopterin S-methyltransferase subunit G